MLKLYCPHQSSNLVKQTISRPNRRQSGHSALKQVLEQVNRQRIDKDPLIVDIDTAFNVTTKVGNNLDTAITNDYIFESIKFQQAIDEIVEREGNPVETGGSFEFYFFRFVSKYNHAANTNLDEVQPSIFQQGFMSDGGGPPSFNNTPQVTLLKPTLDSGDRANTLSVDSDLQTERGTNLIAIGDESSGTYPTEYSRVMGAKEVFETAQTWLDGRDYVIGNLVVFTSVTTPLTFMCIQDNTADDGVNDPSTGLGTFWILVTFIIAPAWLVAQSYVLTTEVNHNEIPYICIKAHTSSSANEPPDSEFWRRENFRPTTDYSPLTQGQKGVQYWLNAMAGAKNASTDDAKTCVIDPSVIIKDDFHPRTWVDCVEDDPSDISSNLLIGGSPFNGFRALVITPATGVEAGNGDWSGTDKNNVAFAGNVVEWQADPIINETGSWVCISSSHPKDPDTLQDQEVFDWEECDSWTKFPCEGVGSFVTGAGVCNIGSRSTTWEKGAYRFLGGAGTFGADDQFTCSHPPHFDNIAGNIDMNNEQLLNSNPDVGTPLPNVATSGVFITFAPASDFQTHGEKHFDFTGANFAFPWPRTAHTSPFATVAIGEQINLTQFDFLNMFQTQDGSEPTWLGKKVEQYYPIQGFSLFNKIVHTYEPLWNFTVYSPTGDYKMGVWLADRKDNVWIIDYNIQYNDVSEPGDANFGNRKVFRAVPGVSTFIPAREPEVLDIVDPRQIVRGGIFTKESFDNQGRYNAGFNRYIHSANIKFSFDAFRMSKPLVCTNLDEPNGLPERNIEPHKLQFEKISSYSQLKNYVLAIAQVYNFRTDAWPVRTPGRCNIKFGDPVFYTDTEAIDETFNPGSLANTVRATAHKITYTLSKGVDGPGGFIRDVELITRLYPV